MLIITRDYEDEIELNGGDNKNHAIAEMVAEY